jgi:actin-related protein
MDENNIPEAPIYNFQEKKINEKIELNDQTLPNLVIDNGSSFIRAGFAGNNF